ncbi:hypothetical protein HKX23_18260 [Sulfitobacter sp. KE29]|uniref:hypothetical protein n=2 Tax=Pseudomonadota TaxID=1224 RepID=UPI0023E10AA7|nr:MULTISPECIES: hypothetical protein [Sulfitobacter]MDF3420294.1 hypothetical protein [Sulfitobacter sp. Ks38]MDF3427779.1 hypothetical protein [Sulfitobacter sp. KE29]MDF3431363.1 hypothetical protein [Sulfitobacter sp. S46]MDF3446132.1 hypothetical protein [Sulfitobacter sp. KE31]MDF3550147.1 hypothetical protein [Sulfitobacter sp. KE28]
MRVFRIFRKLLLAGVIIGLLALNIATVAFSSVTALVAGAYEVVTGATSVTSSMKQNLDQKSKRVNALSREVYRKNKRIASLSNEVLALKKGGLVTYRGKSRKLSDVVSNTAKRVSRRTTGMAARNASSVVASGIPMLGIAVVVGVTAADLSDSCANIKDLRELERALEPGPNIDTDLSEVCGLTVPSKEAVWAAVKSSPGRSWEAAKMYVPDLPEFRMPSIDWAFWK